MPDPAPGLVFVTGGARSGKSHFAERRAAQAGQAVTYLATAQALDEEMASRIARHRAERPAGWVTVEEPLALPEALRTAGTPTALVDCLSLWVSNLMLSGLPDGAVLERVGDLLEVAGARPGLTLCVTNEVGLGLVPEYPLGRRYRDLLGWANQRVAAASREAWLTVSGLPLRLGDGGAPEVPGLDGGPQ